MPMKKPSRGERTKKNKAKKTAGAGAFFGAKKKKTGKA